MPLQLIIMVVIAGIAIAIIVAWLTVFSGADLAKIERTAPSTDVTDATTSIAIKAWDTKGNPLSGASITMEGCGVVKAGTTGADGTYTASGLNIEIPGGSNFCTITVTGRYTGNIAVTKTLEITVSRA
jgi:hypothetical protein